jgi:cell division protein FtsB
MLVRTRKKPLTPLRLIKPLGWMLVAFYMGYHALHGERGLYALMRDQREQQQLAADLAQTRSARERMELRVAALRDQSLDRDLLDEQMRRMLGVMRQGEVVLLPD